MRKAFWWVMENVYWFFMLVTIPVWVAVMVVSFGVTLGIKFGKKQMDESQHDAETRAFVNRIEEQIGSGNRN